MSYKPYFQQKLKISYFSNTQKNFNIFGMNGKNKKNRDITPFRKYKHVPKKTPSNNIMKKNTNNNSLKKLKIEGDLVTSTSMGMKRSKTPIHNLDKKNSNLNSISVNNSIKLNKSNNRQIPKNNSNNKNSGIINYFSPLNKNNKVNYNRAISPNSKVKSLKSQNYNNHKIKFNRSTTPIPRSKISLNKNNSKNSFSNSNIFNNKKQISKSPFLRIKNKNFLSSSNISSKLNPKKGLNTHYNNFFKSKNIFAKYGSKNKPKVITINMNINQNFLSTSSKNNNNDTNNKSPRTAPFIEQINNLNNNTNNNSNNDTNNRTATFIEQINNLNNDTNNNTNNGTNNTNNNKIINNNTNIVVNNSANNNNFNILNKFNNISKIESNNSLIINGIQSNNKKENSSINKVENSNNNINNIQNQNNNISPKQVRKKILCMHEFSKTGYAGEDEKKINQDNYFVFRNFVNNVNYIFMAVCDGHGAVGQEISNFLKENLPIDLNHALKNKKKDILTDDISDIITDIFIQENNKLISNEMINSLLSGSTCVSTIYTPIKLITANVGDSRIILGKFYSNLNKWISIDITRDHKPSLPDEEKRILEKGGRIEPMRDEDNTFIGPPRVWLKEQDYPGLAMSRSFGDRVAHSVGVSEEPEIKEYTFCKEDKFFVVASDGLFEFISSHDIVVIIKDFYLSGDIVRCCEYLYKLSREKWMKEEEVVDDITMILVFLEDE